MKTAPDRQITRYRRLSLWVSGPALLLLLLASLLPVVRRYTVVNQGDESIFVTPLIHFRAAGTGPDAADEDPARVAAFAVLPQYRTFHLPAWPAGQVANLLVPAHSERALFIEYDDLKQETGAQVLLVRTAGGRSGYVPADFWERTVVAQVVRLPPASPAMRAAAAGSAGNQRWLVPATLLLLAAVFPGLWLYHWGLHKKARH